MNKTKKTVMLAMYCSLAYVAMILGKYIPIAIGFLHYDPKDIIITMAGFAFGPLSAFLVSVIVSFIEMITVSTTGFIGFVMNALGSAAFACTAAWIYRKKKNITSAVAATVAGTLAMTFVMILWNYLITPLYLGYSRKVVAAMIPTVFLPFNLIKGGINAIVTVILFQALKGSINKKVNEEKTGHGNVAGPVIISAIIIITIVLMILAKFNVI